MSFVLDASAAMSLLAPSQSTAASRAFALTLPNDLIAPSVLRIEVRHALRRLERADRVDTSAADASLAQLERLIAFEPMHDHSGLDRAMALSRAQKLGYFDALERFLLNPSRGDSHGRRMLILDLSLSRRRQMGRSYAMDLRLRVVAAMEEGATQEEAAERFSVGKSTAGAWWRLKRASGDVAPGKQGRPEGLKLDAHEDFIMELVEKSSDISLSEIVEKLDAERGVRAAVSQVWCFFDRRGVTFKKRPRTPPNRSAKTSPPHAKRGANGK